MSNELTGHDEQQTSMRSRLLTLVFTDLVDSVGLKSRLGDAEAGRLILEHHQAVTNLSQRRGGREILVAGDGCFLTFETPSEAVHFALDLQDHHRRVTALPSVRIGIHMGEVTERYNTPGSARPLDVEGLAVDIASRIQSLAEPRQILLSYPVFDNARQRLDSSHWTMPVEWRAHGRYSFQGTDTSVEIYEAGLKGVAPFTAPVANPKANRDVHADEEQTLGWRPAQGLPLPGKPHWHLEKKLGEGGFGDVWLATHAKTGDRHVVKFCYSVDRLRALKREVTLFRLLKESLGTRQDIARVLDYQFDTQPYYLEIEYAGPHTLSSWMQEKGGVHAIPLETRLELVAQVAEATAAAHSAGVLHKDIKPSNIMVRETSAEEKPQIRMIDFGIGALEDARVLEGKDITVTGLTEVDSSSDNATSMTGTRLFMAPERIEGRPATTKSDIYSLGVLLYQMISGKMGQSLAPGWERDIDDELLREDIAACVDGVPEHRLNSADELVWRLRHLQDRHAKRLGKLQALREEEQRRQRMRQLRVMALVGGGIMVMLLLAFAMYAFMQSQKATSEALLRGLAEESKDVAEAQRQKAHEALDRAQQARYFASIALAEASLREARFQKAQDVLLDEPHEHLLRREWGWLLAQTSPEDFALRNKNLFDAEFLPDGNTFVISGRYQEGPGYVAWYSADSAEMTTRVQTNNLMNWNVAVNADGTLGATASRDMVVTLVDLQTHQVRRKLNGHTAIVRDVAFSPDNRLVASCARDETLRLWGLQDPTLDQIIALEKDSPTEIAFSPDSRYIVTGSLEGNVRVFDTTSGTQVSKLTGITERVLSVCFMADGQAIAATDTIGKTLLYRWPPPPDGTEISPYLEIKSNESYPTQVDSSPDGASLFIGNDNGTIVKVDAETGEEQFRITVDQPLWKIDLSPNGGRLLTTTRWSVRLIDLNRLDEKSTVTLAPRRIKLDLPPDVNVIDLVTVFNQRDQTWRGDVDWRTTTGLSLVTTSLNRRFLVQSPYVPFSPDNTNFISIDPQTQRWRAVETTSGRTLLNMRRNLCVGAVYSPDATRVAILSEKKNTVVYSTSTWKPLYVVPRVDSPVSAIFTPDSKRLIIGDLTGLIEEFDATNGQKLREFGQRGTGMPLDLALSPRADLLAVGSDQERALVFDMKTGDQISTMSGHVRYVHGVRFSPDSERLTTLSRDGTVKMWDVQSGRELVTLFSFSRGVLPLGIHFGPMGRSISVVTSDKQVITTEVFPWNLKAYGDDPIPLRDRLENWKRKIRLGRNATTFTPDSQ